MAVRELVLKDSDINKDYFTQVDNPELTKEILKDGIKI